MNKICKDDNECPNNSYCAFDEKTMKHYCKSNNKNQLYYGCLEGNNMDFENIVSNDSNNLENIDNCIDFSRRQIDKNGLYHNYMLYKKKKVSYVDITTINIYLKCGQKNISVLSLNDYFDFECDNNNENCILKTNKLFRNFVNQNKELCSEQLYLEINYECFNENINNKEIIPVDIDKDDITIKLSCPKNKSNDSFNSKCVSLYIDPEDLKNMKNINTKKLLYNCPNPVYELPRKVSNINGYKKLNFQKNNKEINNYDENIIKKNKELEILQAKKYMKIKKINNNENITINNALKEIKNKKYLNDVNKKWKSFQNYDALQYLNNIPQSQSAIKKYGKVYSLQEAINISSQLNESFFVYYSNSYELSNYSSNLYFVDIFNVDNDIFDKKNWVKAENVTTSILNFEDFYQESGDQSNDFAEKLETYLRNMAEYQKILSNEYINLTGNKINEINVINENIINNMVDNLDKKNSTKNKIISMNNSEEAVNNRLINILTIVLIILITLAIFIFVYYHSLAAAKVQKT